jgi:hypothetical protein
VLCVKPEKNIKYDRSKGMLIFYICWSKTIQCGERTLYIPLVEIPNSSLCPLKAYNTWKYI